MIRRIFVLSLLLILGVCSLSYAAAVSTSSDKARAATTGVGIDTVAAIADAVTGNAVDVDSRGSASTREYPKQVTSDTGGDFTAGAAMVTGECYVYNISLSGIATSAGDYVLIYDALSATGTPKFEVTVGTAKDTNQISIPGGAKFSTGVFGVSNAAAVFCSVVYDN